MPETPDDIWTSYAAEFGDNLRSARKRRKLSQQRIAAAAGISTFTLRKLEHGVSNPGSPSNPQLLTFALIAEVLEVPMASLLPADPKGLAPGRA